MVAGIPKNKRAGCPFGYHSPTARPLFFLALLFFIPFSYGIANVTYDISTAVSDITGGSQIYSVLADEKHHIVYFGTVDNKFGYFNETSNTSVSLTSKMNWTAGEYHGLTLDDDKNIIYVTTSQDSVRFGYYNLSSNTSTLIGYPFTYFARIIFDKNRNVIWYVSNDGDLGYYSLLNNTKISLAIHGSGAITSSCLDRVDDRLYGFSYADARIPFYFSIDNETIVDLSDLQTNIYDCDISYDLHYVYLATASDFSYNSYYVPATGVNNVILYSGDINPFLDIDYMQNTHSVALAEASGFGPEIAGRILNISSNNSFFIRDTDLGDWMGTTQMYKGDYMNTSRRYYFGFIDGEAGYYDNNFSSPIAFNGTMFQNLSSNFINNSNINLSNISNYPIVVKYISWNETNLNITIKINGTYEDSVLAANNTNSTLYITSINATGNYRLSVSTKYETIIYDFRVIEQISSPPLSNSSLIAVAILLLGAVFILAYLGVHSSNEILKMLLNSFCLLALAGLSHIANIMVLFYNLGADLASLIFWFTMGFLSIFSFLMLFTIYSLSIFVLGLVMELKDRKKNIFKINTKDKSLGFK